MTALATAIQRKQWDFVALCLLIGVAEVASTLPPETLGQLLDLLELDTTPTSPPRFGEGPGVGSARTPNGGPR
jgi:hypothetical protein